MGNKFVLKSEYEFDDLVKIMKKLRAKDGCPWDIEQDHKSIRNNLIEEVYEAVEAIDNNDTELLKEELGDVLLQVVFHAQIEDEKSSFDISSVADRVCKKLILRHPHVFGDVKVENSSEVIDNWNKIKQIEKNQKTVSKSMDDVAKSLPALMRAEKIFKRARKAELWDEEADSLVMNMHSYLDDIKNGLKNNGSFDKSSYGKLLTECVKMAVLYEFEAEQLLYDECDNYIKQHKSK